VEPMDPLLKALEYVEWAILTTRVSCNGLTREFAKQIIRLVTQGIRPLAIPVKRDAHGHKTIEKASTKSAGNWQRKP
jgi:hypothetical protein